MVDSPRPGSLLNGDRLFGTDGVRGLANLELTPELATGLGRAAGLALTVGPALVGRDTRRSGEMLSLALQAGFHSAGIDTVDVGVMPAGGISHLTGASGATMGAVVSASHNPAEDNGIKFLSSTGMKLSDDEEAQIEARLRQPSTRIPTGELVGTRFVDQSALDRYLRFLATVARYSYRGMELVIDAANGAAFQAAPALFRKLGAVVEEWAVEPNGVNINLGCGSTNPEFLASKVRGRIGLAFDGDADRLLAVDEDGIPVNGDVMMAIIARHWKSQGRLKNNVLVVTVMSNLGLRRSLGQAGIDLIETQVGDRYVLEAMQVNKAVMGGEQSGHVIFLDKGKTGDGLLTAIRLLDVVAGTGTELRVLRKGSMVEYPQVLRNVRVGRGVFLQDAQVVWEAVAQAERELGEDGRVLVRASGTEPMVRVMVEASSQARAVSYADRLAEVVSAALAAG
ncbi:MAG: phosphoglucosamine mutase [Actinomycetota bacterium]